MYFKASQLLDGGCLTSMFNSKTLLYVRKLRLVIIKSQKILLFISNSPENRVEII